MKQIQKKVLVQMLLGFLVGRVVLLGRNPAGAAFFVAGCMSSGNAVSIAISVFLGMLSALNLETALRYGIAMVGLAVASDLFRQRRVQIQLWQSSSIMAVTLVVLSAVQYLIQPFRWTDVLYTAMEAVLVVALARIFYEGQSFWQDHRKGDRASQEELISIILTGLLAIWGIPAVMVSDISLTGLVVLFLLPALAYQYGMGIGAVAGSVGGMLLSLDGQESGIVGSLCLAGICTGALRRHGKVCSLSAYLFSFLCIGLAWNRSLLELGTIKTLVIDSVALMLLPDRLLRRSRIPVGEREGTGETYSQKLMEYKLKDFSDSFQKLSHVLKKQSEEKSMVSRHDIRMMMKEMPAQVCEKCSNRDGCMGRTAMNRPENIQMLAQEQGQLVLEQMPSEFVGECIHPDLFLMEMNQGLRMARTVMGFENKLAQNRQILAGQMEQVGILLEALAEDMGDFQDIPLEMERAICDELGNMRVKVRDLTFFKDKDGRLEVHMLVETTRGRLVTAKEAALVLTDLLGKPFMPSRESHSVIPRQEVPMIFVEDTPFYAVTGVGRLAREGEEVSGDAFSCLSLPNGELLLALSDGMGSGEEALGESQSVIELLEQMTEAGFSRISALKLINSLYMPESGEDSFATADVVVIDLYQGNCQFFKSGAAATWLRRRNGVERIEGQALPMGVSQDAEPYREKTQLSSGDYVIMMTDGVVDAFAGKERGLEELLGQQGLAANPQELAEYIVDRAVEGCGGHARDDMSVVVAGIWGKVCQADVSVRLQRNWDSTKRKRGYGGSEVLSHGQEVL